MYNSLTLTLCNYVTIISSNDVVIAQYFVGTLKETQSDIPCLVPDPQAACQQQTQYIASSVNNSFR